MADVDRQVGTRRAGSASAIKCVHVDDRGNDAPKASCLVRAANEHRQAGDEGAAPLHEVDRAGEHGLAAVARAKHLLALTVELTKIETDRPFIAFSRALKGDDEIGRDRYVVEKGVASQQCRAEAVEASLVDLGLGGDVGGEPAHELDFAAKVGFQPIVDSAKLRHRLGASARERELAVLVVGDCAHQHGDDGRDRSGKIARATETKEQGAQIHRPCPHRPPEYAGAVWLLLTMGKRDKPMLNVARSEAGDPPRGLTAG